MSRGVDCTLEVSWETWRERKKSLLIGKIMGREVKARNMEGYLCNEVEDGLWFRFRDTARDAVTRRWLVHIWSRLIPRFVGLQKVEERRAVTSNLSPFSQGRRQTTLGIYIVQSLTICQFARVFYASPFFEA